MKHTQIPKLINAAALVLAVAAVPVNAQRMTTDIPKSITTPDLVEKGDLMLAQEKPSDVNQRNQ